MIENHMVLLDEEEYAARYSCFEEVWDEDEAMDEYSETDADEQ